jgi:hypothetical protein
MNTTALDKDNAVYHERLIDELTACDVAFAHNPPQLDEPHLLDHVAPTLVESSLKGDVADAEIDHLEVDVSHAGMTSRRKLLIQWNKAGQQADLPTSLFVKATPPTAENRQMLAVLHMDEMECRFYDTIRKELPDIAPNSYYAKHYGGGRHLLFVEDLDARECKPLWLASECSIEHANATAVALATLHRSFWESERLVADLSWVKPHNRRYGWRWLFDLSSTARNAFLGSSGGESAPQEIRELIMYWDQHARAGYEYFSNLPRTVLHGDSHLGNTFIYPDGRAGLFDWQVMFSGHGLRDLNYFLYSALNNEDRKTNERDIFELYLDTLAEGGVQLNPEIAWNDYCLYTMDRWDSSMIARMGEYGHDSGAQARGLEATIGGTLDNDVIGRVHHLIKNP